MRRSRVRSSSSPPTNKRGRVFCGPVCLLVERDQSNSRPEVDEAEGVRQEQAALLLPPGAGRAMQGAPLDPLHLHQIKRPPAGGLLIWWKKVREVSRGRLSDVQWKSPRHQSRWTIAGSVARRVEEFNCRDASRYAKEFFISPNGKWPQRSGLSFFARNTN